MNETNAETRRSRTDTVKEKVGEAKDTVQETASHLASDAREKTGHIAAEGRDKVHELGDRAQEMARTRADEQKQRLTNGIRTFADVLRRGSDDLSAEQNQYRPLLNGAADRVEGVSRYLEQRDVDALTSDVRRFARDHSPAFIAGAFALGFVGARFLKSSGEHAVRERGAFEYRGSERFDRMLPETGSLDANTTGAGMTEPRTFASDTRTDGSRTGSSSFADGGSMRGGTYE